MLGLGQGVWEEDNDVECVGGWVECRVVGRRPTIPAARGQARLTRAIHLACRSLPQYC